MPAGSKPLLRFGDFHLDPCTRELCNNGRKVKLQEQPFQVLTALLERPGQLISRDELKNRLWRSDTFVDFEHSLNKAVNRLREALQDSPSKPCYIETLPRLGYRIVCEVIQTGVQEDSSAQNNKSEDARLASTVLPDSDHSVFACEASKSAARPRLTSLIVFAGAGILVVALTFFGGWSRLTRAKQRANIDSVAVLPLENLSGDKEQEYFSEGMTDELINTLASVKSLRVISRTSVMRYKSERKPLPEIARELNVAAIVEGSVLRAGNRVRITVQLVDGRSDVHLWARSFERNLDDVLSMQAEVAEAVAGAVGLQLTDGEKAKLLPAHTDVPAAHDAYLQGRYRWSTRTRRGLNESIAYYQRAIAADPNFAPAYVGIADSYAIMTSVGWLTWAESYPAIKRAATAAVQIDPDLAEGHQMLGEVKEEEWNWAGAEREYFHAIELNPGLARAHQWYAVLLIALNRPQDAIAEIERAIALDPLGIRLYATESYIFYLARQFDRALVPLQPLEAMNQQPVLQHLFAGLAYIGQREYDRAIVELQTVVRMEPGTPDSLAYLGCAYALAGRTSDAIEILTTMTRLRKTKNVDPALMAMIWASLGDHNRALRFLNEAYAAHSSLMMNLAVDPLYDPLRQDPLFTDLVRRVGLPAPNA